MATEGTLVRSRRVVLVVALVAAGVYGATVGVPSTVEGAESSPPDRLVSPAGTDSHVWPYTSQSQSVDGRTLPVNVVVRGDSDRVRHALTDRSDANWSALDPNATVEVSPWRPAHGSTRYTYVTPSPNDTGRWTTADYQLEVGTYFGRRTHVRAYVGPSGDWTALQAHTEYWDWFRLRHTVTGVETGAQFVERDLHDEPFVVDVSRTDHGEDGGGWTVVELLSATLVAGLAVPLTTRRLSRTDLLPLSLVGLVLGVRAWGLAAEAAFPAVTPKLFVAVGYPVLAAGPPALVAILGDREPANRVALFAAAGIGTGTVLDLFLVGVRQIPVHLALHRLALMGALAAFALGDGRGDRRVAGVALVAWVVALAAPLFGVV